MVISCPIRAGLLLNVDRDRLVALIASLEPLRSEEPDDTVRVERAARLIKELRNRKQLFLGYLRPYPHSQPEGVGQKQAHTVC
jgi:hypothetical protein